MHSAESPSLSEAYNETEIAARDVRGGRDAFDERIRIAPEDSGYDERLRWTRSEGSQRGSYRPTIKKRSLGKRMTYATTRFVVVVLIGVAATLGWQAYGDQARAMLAGWDPSLAWLNPAAATQSVAAAPVSATDLAQQLKPITLEIAAVRHDLEQLAAKQEQLAANQGQLAQGLSALLTTEHEVGAKISSLAAPKPVHVQPRQPPQLQPRQPAPRALLPPEELERQ